MSGARSMWRTGSLHRIAEYGRRGFCDMRIGLLHGGRNRVFPFGLASRQLQSPAPSPREWCLHRSWLRVDGETLEVETGVLQVGDSSDAVTAGASSVLALHCSAKSHEQWTELAVALRRQQIKAIAAYDAGETPTAPIWSTPRAISAPNFFGYGKSSPWKRPPRGSARPQKMEDLVRVMNTAAAAAHATRAVEGEGLDAAQYINLLKDLGASTKRLESHFFRAQTTSSLNESFVDEKSALGISMEALSQVSSRGSSVPAIAASAPPRWRLLGQSMGAAIALQALLSEPKFGAALDSIVFFEPAAFALLYDPRCSDKNVAREYELFVASLVSHAEAENWDDWVRVYFDFWCPEQTMADGHCLRAEEREHVIATALSTTNECVANLEAMVKASSDASTAAVDALAALPCPKHVVMSSETAGGARAPLHAVMGLLEQHAGFSVHTSPGGHFSPYTHSSETMPLLAKCLLDMSPADVAP